MYPTDHTNDPLETMTEETTARANTEPRTTTTAEEAAPQTNAPELEELINKGRVKTAAAAANSSSESSQSPEAVERMPQSFAGLTQEKVAQHLTRIKARLTDVLGDVMTPERVVQMAATTISKNPTIAECTTASLLGAVMQAATLRFPPIDSLGYCYFVPYYNAKTGTKEVQFQIGYKGLIDMARRSGRLRDISAEAVYQGDTFEISYGLERSLKHIPHFLHPGKPEMIEYVYAVATLADGGKTFVVLPRIEIERLRQRSPGQRAVPSGAWLTDYEAMAKAKAIKQLAKFLPLNLDDLVGFAKDETTYRLDPIKQSIEEYSDYSELKSN